MVCNRCIAVVAAELSTIGLNISSIFLGEVSVKERLNDEIKNQIAVILSGYGFELLEDKNQQLVQKVKLLVKDGIEEQMETRRPVKFSELLSAQLSKDYNSLSSLFSSYEGITLEKYIISERLKIVTYYLANTKKSLTEVSDELGYSSVSHLTRQLKSYTGHDVNHYKRLRSVHVV